MLRGLFFFWGKMFGLSPALSFVLCSSWDRIDVSYLERAAFNLAADVSTPTICYEPSKRTKKGLAMETTLDFQCECGSVSGHVNDIAPDDGLRFVCHCDDCQVSAHALDHPETLDVNGGTSAALLDSSKLKIDNGLDKLATMRVAAIKSRPVLRWYCNNCKTPLFNTYDSSYRSFLSFLLANSNTVECDRLLGPSMGHVWKKFSIGDVSDKKSANLLRIIARMVWRQIHARISGDFRNTPLFDPQSGKPIATPIVLPTEKRKSAELQIGKLRKAANSQ